jgi:ABC-type branched-subunit amino acid transport system permease subunit
VIYTFIREQLEANFQNLDLLAFGLLLIAIVLFEPLGIVGAFDRFTRKRATPTPPPVLSAKAGDG